MSLQPGARLSAYEVLGMIGTGQPLFGLSDFTLGFQGRRHVEVLG